MPPLLEIAELEVRYGAVRALRGISFTVEEGEIVTLIGANGAGKTTTLRTISGLVPARGGSVRYGGRDLHTIAAHRRVRRGLVHVPEGRVIFGNLTVQENLDLAAWWRRDRGEVRADLEQVSQLFPRLAERRGQRGGTLSGGEQQMLAVARGIMARPRLMLLDEPSMGLAPLLVREIFHAIREIRRLGTAVLLVEQNVNMALAVANRAYVLQTGEIVLEGPPEDLRENAEVRAAYLGETPTGQRETE
ncbi:MAG TPA: ABC transporter ATP-binding protein [Candidatus Methylomirabilis sp.]|jgi:branched-chain amino acid transport system ATP-binding protein|nr:ABC transporter ATP-binding protein [Candidatus Methylomirabilis sp.]